MAFQFIDFTGGPLDFNVPSKCCTYFMICTKLLNCTWYLCNFLSWKCACCLTVWIHPPLLHIYAPYFHLWMFTHSNIAFGPYQTASCVPITSALPNRTFRPLCAFFLSNNFPHSLEWSEAHFKSDLCALHTYLETLTDPLFFPVFTFVAFLTLGSISWIWLFTSGPETNPRARDITVTETDLLEDEENEKEDWDDSFSESNGL